MKKELKGKKIVIEVPDIPPSVNHAYGTNFKTGARYLKSAGRKFQELVAWHCLAFVKPGILFQKERLKVEIEVYFDNKRRCDLDNRLKVLLDALEYARVLKDDSQIDDLRIVRKYAEKKKTKITISEIKYEDEIVIL